MNGAHEPQDLPGALSATLAKAERWVVMTGAGISAESGVPTFRDAQTGLWAKYDAEELATPQAFADNPRLVWDWYVWRRELIHRAQPNAGHQALATLAALKPELALITQNVDGLHQRAGNSEIVEFHGNINRNKCFTCDRIATGAPETTERPPQCEACGGLLRPDVVWFGEAIPTTALEASFRATHGCETFLSVGTSALVYPAAGLAEAAAAQGAIIIEINTNPTPLTSAADYALQGSAAYWLPTIATRIQQALPTR